MPVHISQLLLSHRFYKLYINLILRKPVMVVLCPKPSTKTRSYSLSSNIFLGWLLLLLWLVTRTMVYDYHYVSTE